MRGFGLLLVVLLGMFSAIQGWGLGAVLASIGFASLYADKASRWLAA